MLVVGRDHHVPHRHLRYEPYDLIDFARQFLVQQVVKVLTSDGRQLIRSYARADLAQLRGGQADVPLGQPIADDVGTSRRRTLDQRGAALLLPAPLEPGPVEGAPGCRTPQDLGTAPALSGRPA